MNRAVLFYITVRKTQLNELLECGKNVSEDGNRTKFKSSSEEEAEEENKMPINS